MMEISEAKQLVDALKATGTSKGDTMKMISTFSLNGDSLEVFQYAELQYEIDTTLPKVITTSRHLRHQVEDTLNALKKSNNPPHIFRRSGILTRISNDEKGIPFTDPMKLDAVRGKIERAANFVIETSKGESPISPPMDVTKDICSLGEWDFPALTSITESPVLRMDGSILTQPGYDDATGLYYAPAKGLSVPDIPDNPTELELQNAINLVTEILCDFPFDSDASMANAYGAMIAPVLRPAIHGPAPLPIIDKPQAGTGASLITDVFSIISTGHMAAMMGMPSTEEEWEKKLSSHLLAGRSFCAIDNIRGKLYSDTLSRYLTSTKVSIRELGKSSDIRLENNMTIVANGNNVSLGGDMPRRCYQIRLDAMVARPWMRELNFKHPVLREWVSSERGNIIAAILTIAKAWFSAGKPLKSGASILGGFEDYCRIIGGVLQFMGIDGFMTNLISMYEKMDTDTPQWENFMESWLEVFHEKPTTVADLKRELLINPDLAAALPEELELSTTAGGKDYNKRMGAALRRHNMVRMPNGLMIINTEEKYKHAILWAVVSYKRANSPDFVPNSELSEFPNLPLHYENTENLLGCNLTTPNSPIATKSGELVRGANSPGNNRLPKCPKCGNDDEWSYSKDMQKIICQCGHIQLVESEGS